MRASRPRRPCRRGRPSTAGRRRPPAASMLHVSTSTSSSAPSGARDDAALRVARGLVGRERAAAHELADQRVVVGELLQRAVAQQVGARVADVAEGDAPVVDQRGGHRRAHAGGVAGRCARDRGCGGWPRGWSGSATPRQSQPGRVSVRVSTSTASAEATSPALAPPMPSATTNRGERDQVRVLVGRGAPARRPWPTRSRRPAGSSAATAGRRSSRCCRPTTRRRAAAAARPRAAARSRTCRWSTRDPRGTTSSPRRNTRAWRPDANSSPSSTASASSVRARTPPVSSQSTTVPAGKAGLAVTTQLARAPARGAPGRGRAGDAAGHRGARIRLSCGPRGRRAR